MNLGLGLFRKIPWLAALGALAIIMGLVTLTALRATPAHALIDSCNTSNDFLNYFDSQGKIGFQGQISCSSSNAHITGTDCIAWSPSTHDDWNTTYVCDQASTKGMTQLLHTTTPCYTTNGMASFKYRAQASWLVTFPDGNNYGYTDWSTIRTIACSSPALTGVGGGK